MERSKLTQALLDTHFYSGKISHKLLHTLLMTQGGSAYFSPQNVTA